MPIAYDYQDEADEEGDGADLSEWVSDTPASSDASNARTLRRSNDQTDSQRRAGEVWQMALNELALSMPAPTFETWVRDTSVMGYEDGEFVIGVPHAYARDWLRRRKVRVRCASTGIR